MTPSMGAFVVQVEIESITEPTNSMNSPLVGIQFSAGNPRVEHITGIVHLYRDIPEKSSRLSNASPAPLAQEKLVAPPPTDTLCCLAIPADMSVAEFCTFCGAYLQDIREMRVLRREAAEAKVVCMVLVRFVGCQSADSFFFDLNNKPFCSLEPDILCRLVRVRDVEILGPTRGSASGGERGASGTGPLGSTLPAGGTNTLPAGGTNTSNPSSPSSYSNRVDSKKNSPPKPQPSPQLSISPPGMIEIPSCPVCLERLDEHISGVVTTVCNHQFHSECLKKWGDTSCPVCRYCSTRQGEGSGTHSSTCSSCGATSDLWICLICGHVGCGRYKAGHAHDHWKASQHCYALELETQRVWDYAGDNYVHRLIQSKTDGKLVEINSRGGGESSHMPENCHGSPDRPHRRAGSVGFAQGLLPLGGVFEGGSEWLGGGAQEGDEELKEAIVNSKVDAIEQEYSHLLATQLDSQRQFFESLLAGAERDCALKIEAAEQAALKFKQEAEKALAQAKDSDRKRQSADKKLADAVSSLELLKKEKDFFRSLNETLLANQKDFQQQLQLAKTEAVKKEAAFKDMEEQVRDLMVYIEAQKVLTTEGGEELRGGSSGVQVKAVKDGRRRQER